MRGHEPAGKAGKGWLLGSGWARLRPTQSAQPSPKSAFLSSLPSGRPADSCLLQHFPWSWHQPGAGPALSARVQGRHPGETLPPVEGGPLGEAGRDPCVLSRSQACRRADLRQAGGSDQVGDGRGSARGSPGSKLQTLLCKVHPSL